MRRESPTEGLMREDRVERRAHLLTFQRNAYHLALRITGKVSDAEDVRQEAHLRAIRHEGAIPMGNEARKWFPRMVANAAKNHQVVSAHRKTRERAAGAGATDPAQTPDARQENEELRMAATEALTDG